MGIGDWGLGIGDWGMGGWGWGQCPQPPYPPPHPLTPNPQSPFFIKLKNKMIILNIFFYFDI